LLFAIVANHHIPEPVLLHNFEIAALKWISAIALAIEIIAILIIVIAVYRGLFHYLKKISASRNSIEGQFTEYRTTLGRALLLGLEILVAADIIKTVALETSIESVVVLGILVFIRITLGWSLIVELEGRWPWQPKPGAILKEGDD